MTKYSSLTILRAFICFSLLRACGTFSNIDLSTQTLDPPTTGFMITGNAANDSLGISVSTAGDIDGDGYDDIIVGAYTKNNNQGVAYVIYGGPKSTMANIALGTQTLNPLTTGFMITGNAASDYFGRSVSTAGDIDGDGYDDIIVGAYGKNSYKGAAYVIYGGPKSSMSNIALSTQTLDPLTTGFMITENATGDQLGISVSAAGDIDGDGYDDIIIGAYFKNSYKGAAYVIYGGPKSTMANIALGTQTLNPLTTGFMITGNAGSDFLGNSVSTAGDINKDGYDDIFVGASGKNSNQGAAYVIYGGPKSAMTNILLSTQTLNPLATGFMITGNAGSDRLGSSVSAAGDINGDGYGDIIVGASQKNSYQGAAYVIYGGPKSTMTNILLSTQTLDPLTTGFMITGNASGDFLGNSVSTAGDINKDGYDDIFVGAYFKNGKKGAAYAIYGGSKSTMSNIDLGTQTLNPLTTGFMITGSAANDLLGVSVSTAGDIDGDGYDDIIVGAYTKNNNQGAAYLIYPCSTCSSCPTNCNTCTSASVCTGCTNPYLLYQSQCVSSCPVGTFVSTNTCQDCSTNCNTCSSASVCTGCKSSYLLYQSQCLSSCPAGTFVSTNTCQDCSTNCNTCTSASVCTGCTSPYLLYQAQCLSSCPAGTFVSTNTCQDCSANCNTCTSASVCTVCTSPYLLYQSQCVSSCPVGTFVSTNTCQDCSANCNTCGSASSCTGCTPPYLLYQSQCLGSCPTGTFVSTNTCQDCSTNCNTCSSTSVCTGCTTPYLLYHSQCVSSCPAGTFLSTNTCQDCSTNCNTCTSASLCTLCTTPYLLYQSQCVSSCPAGTFPSTNTCQDCSTNCNTCTSASVCTGCTSPYLLYHSQCVSSCPAGTFVSTNTCQDCSTNCNTCTSASVCTGCTAPYLLYQSQCLSSCPAGTFVSTNTCQDCSTNCNTCTSSSACTGCTAPYLLYQSQCLSSCPAGTFVSANICQACSANCNTCSSASVCTVCKSSYLLYHSQCVSSCPAGTFVSTNTCHDCPTNCNTCTSASVCTQCTAPYLLYQSQCVSSCPAGTFVSTNKCQDCPPHCSACTSQNLCQTCDQGYILSNSLCDLSPSPSPSPSFSSQQAQGKATQTISSSTKGIGSAICVGKTTPPVAALVSKTVQNTRYLNLSVTAELAEIYQTWDSDMISWDTPTTFSNEDHFKTSPYLFARYGLSSPFLMNFWPTVMNIGISLTLFIICFVLKKLFERAKYKGWIPFMMHKLLAGSFNFAFVQAYACLDDILFYFVIDTKTNPFNGFFSWASITTAFTFLLVGCLLVFFNFWTVSKYQSIKKQGGPKDLKDFNERNKYWEIFYSDFNDDGLLSQSFFAILIIRSTLSSFIIVVLNYPLIQASILMTLDVAIILFLYFKDPFNTLRGKLAQYYYEVITLLVHICTFILSLQDTMENPSDKLMNIVCTGIIYLNTALIVGSVGFMFIEIYKTIEKARDEKRKQRQNISEDSQEARNQTRRISPFQSLESDASNMQARINRDQSVSVENRYFFPGVNQNGNITNYDLNMESSRDFNADTSRELYVNPIIRIYQQRNPGAMPRIVRPRPLRMNRTQQRSRYIDTSHVENTAQTDHT